MKCLTGRFCLLALSEIFFSDPCIAIAMLAEVDDPSQLFDCNRSRFRHFFDGKFKLFKKYKEFNDWKRIQVVSEKLKQMNIEVISIRD